MIWLSLLGRFWYVLVIAALLAAAIWFKHSATVERTEKEAIQAEYNVFKAEVARLGEIAKTEKARKEAEDAKIIRAAITSRTDALNRLRDQINSSGSRASLTPQPAAGSDQLCFDQGAFAAAVEQYRRRVRGLVGQGDEAAIDSKTLLEAWPR